MTDNNVNLPLLSKGRDELLDDYKKIKEADWWRLCKFPLLICGIISAQVFSPPEFFSHNILLVFFVAAWLEISMKIYRVNKKLDIFYKIESGKGEQK